MALDSASVTLKFNASQSGANDMGNPIFSPSFTKTLPFTSGTGLNQADLLFTDRRTVAASTNDDIDLAGSLASAYGATITFVKLVGIIISNTSLTQTLTVGAGSNPFISWLIATGDGIKIPPGGMFCLFAPDATALAVTASTGDILRVANGSGSSADFDIILLGRSA